MNYAAIKIAVFLFLFLSGCSPSFYYHEYQFKGGGRYIQGVPAFPQEDNLCGPSSLASVLNYWGHKVKQDEVAKEVFTPKIKGTITVEMSNYAKKAGFKAVSYKGSIEDIRTEIDQARPLILYLDIGYRIFPRGHYVVVVGYNKEGVIAYSGKDKDVFMPYASLLKNWEKTGNWTLLVMPK